MKTKYSEINNYNILDIAAEPAGVSGNGATKKKILAGSSRTSKICICVNTLLPTIISIYEDLF